MSLWKKIGLIILFLVVTYATAWFSVYRMSSSYFDHAMAQKERGNLVIALKGMNKLEMRIEDQYFGGFQQVIEAWESSLLGPRPGFYEEAVAEAEKILPQLNEEQLQAFIEIYVQLDIRYVPEAALELLNKAKAKGNQPLAQEMDEFLEEAFPDFQY